MNESEQFWLSIVEELANGELPPPLDPSGVAGDTPEWVTKSAAEVMTMLMPRIQLRVGDKATPEKVGALIGNHLALTEMLGDLGASVPGLVSIFEFAKPILGGFDGVLGMQELSNSAGERRRVIVGAIAKILERPPEERFRFFRAFTRGLQPEDVNDVQPTKSDLKRAKTLAVYSAAMMNWRQLDILLTSREAYDFLVRLLSVDVVGHDAERVRRMFQRLGKKFGHPGRPRTRS
jgi:hypothetical protein